MKNYKIAVAGTGYLTMRLSEKSGSCFTMKSFWKMARQKEQGSLAQSRTTT